MQTRALSGTHRGAIQIVALYLLVGGLWILFSDRLVTELTNDTALITLLSLLKGWAFIVVTALLLYWLIQRQIAALWLAQERLWLAYDAADLGTWQYDVQDNLFTPDDRARAIFGLTSTAMSPQEFLSHVHPDDVEQLRQQWSGALSPTGDERYRTEYRMISESGDIHWVSLSGRNYFEGKSEKRHPVLRVGTVQDVTARKETEEILRRYELLVKNTRDIVLFFRRDGMILDVNVAALQAYGYTREEFLQLQVHALRPPQDREQVESRMAETDEQQILYEAVHQRKNGELFPVEISSQAMTLGSVRTVISVLRDISERKRIERERFREADALRDSEAKFRGIAEQMVDGLFVTNAQGILEYVSPSAERLYGWTTEEMIGTPFTQYVADAEIPHVIEMFVKTLTSGKRLSQFELTLKRKDGSHFAGELNASILIDGAGPIKSVGLVRDVTERNLAQAKIRASAETMTMAQEISHFGSWETGLTPEATLMEPARCSDEFYRILGLEPQSVAITSDFLNSVTVPEDLEPSLNAFNKTLRDKGMYSFEYRILRPDKSVRYVHEQAHVISDATTGAPFKIVGTIHDITERKLNEDALREREAKLSALFAILPVGVAILNPERRIIETNSAQERIQKLSRGELLAGHYANRKYADKLGALISPHDYPSVVAMREQRTVLDVEMGIVLEGDTPAIWTNVSAAPLPDGGAVVATTDITERKLAEQALRQSREHFAKAFHSNPAAMIITRMSDGKIIDANVSYHELLEYSGAELMQRNGLALNIYDNAKERAAILEILQLNGSVKDYETSLRAKSGALRQVLISIEKIELDQEPCILSILHDITARKQAERAISESEQRFSKVFHSSPVSMAISRASDGLFVDVNTAFTTLTGFSRIQTVGHLSSELEILSRDTEQAMTGALTEHSSIHNLQTTMRHQSGVQRDVLASIEAIELNKETCILATAVDITERIQTEHALRESEVRYRSLFENMLNGFSFCRMLYRDGEPDDYVYLEVNTAFERLTGLKDVINKSVCDLIPNFRETNRELLERYNRVAVTGEPDRLEAFVPQLDGGQWFSVAVYCPQPGHFVTLFEDITERKQAEQALREISDNMAMAQRIGHIGSWEVKLTPDLQILDAALWSDECYRIFGLEPRSIEITNTFFKQRVHPEDRGKLLNSSLEKVRDVSEFSMDYRIILPDGGIRHLYDQVKLILDPQTSQPIKLVGMMHDVTERKQAEEALRESEERYRLISTVASDYMFSTKFNLDGTISHHWIGGAFEQMTGYSVPEYRARGGWRAIIHPDDLTKDDADIEMMNARLPVVRELRLITKSGQVIWVRSFGHPVWDEQEHRLLGVYGGVQDITERKLAEIALRDSEERIKAIIESAMDGIITVDESQRIVLFNTAAERMFGCSAAETLGQSFERLIPKRFRNSHAHLEQTWIPNEPGESSRGIMQSVMGLRADGQEFPIEASVSQITTAEGKLYTVLLRDITERKQAEEAIRYQANLLANVSDAIISTDLNYNILSWNRAAETIYGWKESEVLGKSVTPLLPIEYLDTTFEQVIEHFSKHGHWEGITRQGTASGAKRYIASSVTLIRDHVNQPVGSVAVNRDITELDQQQRELEAIALLSSALRTATDRTGMLDIVLEQVIKSLGVQTALFVHVNPTTGKYEAEAIHGTVNEALQNRTEQTDAISHQVILTGVPFVENNLSLDIPEANRVRRVLNAIACVPLIAQHQSIGVLWVAREQAISESELRILVAVADIAANAIYRAELYAKTEQQLDRIETLHVIDTAIASSFDLKLTLNLLLEQVTTRLHIDAAAIFLYSPSWLNLEFAAGRGFRQAPARASLRLGEGLAGRAALEREIKSVPDLNAALADNQKLTVFDLAAETLVSYCGVPLVMKGQVKGVLELYSHDVLPGDHEWNDYLKTLAQQAAIAIDNVELFNSLQRSNLELGLAYDATIEGWSRALDLRDKETEGHTLRVTELTIRLARAFNIHDSEIVHIRRGALLHDIGKMGVPDTILLKPDKLTDEEWTVMRRHPGYAYQMLSPIAYLRPSLDIPYYHHEKWDGTGYPTGRAGEQIPLVARLFAVVDVWDALTSDRTYRKAWSPERAAAYILEQRGKHFDPQVVDTFLNLIQVGLQDGSTGE